jgi:immunoglobulin-binding protein 1
VITSKREELQAGVFRPSWRLPTMSIDEYLEEEMRRGNMISGGGYVCIHLLPHHTSTHPTPRSEESGRITEIDEDDEEAADAATFKARDWDEFLDANPRGSGNRIGKG